MHSFSRSVNWNETFITFLRRWYCYFNSATCLGLLFLLSFFSLAHFVQYTQRFFPFVLCSASFSCSSSHCQCCAQIFFTRSSSVWIIVVETKFLRLSVYFNLAVVIKNCPGNKTDFSCLWEPNELCTFLSAIHCSECPRRLWFDVLFAVVAAATAAFATRLVCQARETKYKRMVDVKLSHCTWNSSI